MGSPRRPPVRRRGRRERQVDLRDDPDELERLVRILGASTNVDILRALAEARRGDPDGGWMFLSQIAEATEQAPGSVGLAIEKLKPLLEERRERGRRYFRSRVAGLRLTLDEYAGAG